MPPQSTMNQSTLTTPRVFLIGDSIRMNAQAHVRAYLPPGTSLVCPSVNCESSRQVAEGIAEWAPAAAGDLVHINCGLHDIRHDPGATGPVCTLAQYASNLRVTFEFLSERNATIIWATSTPFLEDVHNSAKASRRYLQDLTDYNTTSIAIAKEYGFYVNDMAAKLQGKNLRELLLPDGLHFNPVGNKLVGELVAAAIADIGRA
jgi:isoamyl acetate esterase